MKKRVTLAAVVEGMKLPAVEVADKGVMEPSTRIEGRQMVLDAEDIIYRPWKLSDSDGRVRTIYHLAARPGLEDVNKAAVGVLRAARLPELLPDAPYKTITIVNFDDALWGTRSVALARMEKKQRNYPHAIFVADEKGHARKAWALKHGQTAVIILDRKGTILFFKEGRLSPEEIHRAVGLIQKELKHT
jgi:YtfJ family uncharacterized protein